MDNHIPNYHLDEISLLRSLSENQSGYNNTSSTHHSHSQYHHRHNHQHQINNNNTTSSSSSSSSPAPVHPPPSSTANATTNNNHSFNQFHGNIDILFQQQNGSSPHINPYLPINSKSSPHNIHPDMSPHYQTVSTSTTTTHNDCMNQEDILTPLISPAITPSHNYQIHHQQQKNQHHHPSNDIHFSPLSSPAILPQNRTSTMYHEQQQQQQTLEDMSATQICEQYEQLEQAKMLITQKLTELQKSQYDYQQFDDNRNIHYQRTDANNHLMTGSKPDNFVHQINDPYFLSNNNPIQVQQQQQHQLNQNQPNNGLYVEPATPASLMNMKRGRSTKKPPSSPLKGKDPLGPRSRQKKPLIHHKKPRREDLGHISPRALKPLLISPTLNPNPRHSLPPVLDKPTSSMEDAERILATRSNYQNLMEGKAAALGIAFSSQIKSGLEVRRTAHKAAEQKRRDSLKEWFDRLRREVEEGYVKKQSNLMSRVIKAQELEKKSKKTGDEEEDGTMKPLSKVLLLQYAYEYITSLKETIAEKDLVIDELKRKEED